ncbi:hypothetical protein C8Q75DRAFT_734283 [Abortiporus biennis]|nr:hypothetical protein C8Q75DRAFT_734283 [Abortiporus biennis]
MSKANISDARSILIIGATAGIGRALALALHDLPSQPQIIVAGRRKERLDELTAKSERIKSVQVDVSGGRESLKKFVDQLLVDYSQLDAVVFSSGIQHQFDFSRPDSVDLDKFEAELTTNYISIVTLIKFLIPHFLSLSNQDKPSFIIPISSGLAVYPAPTVPGYCATKSALHSLSLSLDSQLKDTNVHVMEILPPLVESELHDHQGTTPALSKFWMPLDVFIPQVVDGLKRGDVQIPIGQAAEGWDTFEKGKLERIEQFRQRAASLKK